jgi:hypothetical protein
VLARTLPTAGFLRIIRDRAEGHRIRRLVARNASRVGSGAVIVTLAVLRLRRALD